MPSLEAGRLLSDRYLLQARLGDGGHAEVWRAEDRREGREVALKFLHLRSCSLDEALLVLRHEAQMAQRLDHPGVLKADSPARDGQLVFLPVEYASGGDASLLRGAPWRRVLPVLRAVAEVLEHAHSRGVVHRDVKPGNVLFDAQGNVRITDFGASARTGCSDALAPGSPFSASPQQLRGEPATTADDVYGLGALAYELLTRYPPFYPQFDAARVQAEEPARPVPVHPAPAPLLDLVQQMLAREARRRPDLDDVMQTFDALLAAGAREAQVDAALVVEQVAPRSATPAEVAPPRWGVRAGWLLLAAAAAAGIAVLLWRPVPPAAVAISAPVPVIHQVADAVVAVPVVAAEPAVAGPDVRDTIEQDLAAGAAALAAGQPAQARAAYARVLVRDAQHADATRGIAAAEALAQALADLAEATRSEARGDLAAARDQYQALLKRRPGFAPAASGLARVTQQQREVEFESLLAAGAVALREGRIAPAQDLYRRAAALHPDESRVHDGQRRIAEVLRSQRNAEELAQGAALERQERWADALTHYRQVLARDESLQFAQDGLARSERRAALDQELADYIARPERLTADAVRAAAVRAIARGEASAAQSPRLQAQLRQLQDQLQALAAQARVALTSDNSTVVSVTRLGDLGSFVTRELQLPPGHYTVIGRREGFRDVRLDLHIAPGQRDAALSVRCTERI